MPLSDPILRLAFERAATDPFFAGCRLDQLRREQSLTSEQQAAALGLSLESLVGLSLCRQPRDRADVEMIAARLGWECGRMADLLGVRLSD
jgi:hypothetical protein